MTFLAGLIACAIDRDADSHQPTPRSSNYLKLQRSNLCLVSLRGKGKPAGGVVRSADGQDAGAFPRATAALQATPCMTNSGSGSPACRLPEGFPPGGRQRGPRFSATFSRISLSTLVPAECPKPMNGPHSKSKGCHFWRSFPLYPGDDAIGQQRGAQGLKVSDGNEGQRIKLN